MKKDTNSNKVRREGNSKRPRKNLHKEDTAASGSNGLSMLDAARLNYVATLPMGRPLLTAIVEDNANYDARGLSRPVAVLQDVALNYYGMFTQPSDHPWLSRVATRVVAELRAKVRSNTNYNEADVITYLIQAMNMYTHGVVIKRMLQTSTLYDVRSPMLSTLLNSSYGNIAVDSAVGTIPTIASSAIVSAEGSASFIPTWLRSSELGKSWLESTKLEGALAMYSLPSEVKALIDYYFGQVHVKEADSQYYAIRIIPETSGHLEFDNSAGTYVWISDENRSPAAKGGSTVVAGFWEQASTYFLTGAPVRMSTLAADLRRLEGWEPCFIDMPPELGGAPMINADGKYFLTMGNAYKLESEVINSRYNFSGVQADYKAPDFKEEVRINMFEYSFDDPLSVGVAVLMCDLQRTIGERSHTMWSVRSESLYSEAEGGAGAYASFTQVPLVGCGLLPASNGNYEFPIIGAGGRGPAIVEWQAFAAIQADTLCPRVSLIFTAPTDGTSDRPFRSIVENGADLSNGTRVSFDNVNDVIETFYETLFVK